MLVGLGLVAYVAAVTVHAFHHRFMLEMGIAMFLLASSILQQQAFARHRYRGVDRRLVRRHPVDHGPGPAGRRSVEDEAA